MTKLEAMAYFQACAFMRTVQFAQTTWADDCKEDSHLKEAMEILGLKPDDDRLKDT